MEGLTGRMKFYEGRRTEFELDILQLSDGGLSKVRHNMTLNNHVEQTSTLLVGSMYMWLL